MKKLRGLRRFAVSVLVLAFLAGALVAVKNVVLRQIRTRIESTLHYARLRLTVIPPAIVLEDVRSATASPFFSAQKVVLRISALSLVKRDRPLSVFIDQPVLRIYENDPSRKPAQVDMRLPFSIETGYIRNGDLSFWSRGLTARAVGFKAAFRQAKDGFVLQAMAPETTVLSEAMNGPVHGRIRALVEGRGDRLMLHQLTFDGPDALVKVKGLLFNAARLTYELKASLRAPVARLADFLNLPFSWEGGIEAEGTIANGGGPLEVKARLSSPHLRLNGESIGRVEGPLTLSAGPKGSLRLTLHKESGPDEGVDIDFRPGLVEGRARGVHLLPIIRDFRIPWPVRSPADGTFRVENGTVRVKAAFSDDPTAPPAGGLFAFRGPVEAVWDGREKRLDLSSEKLESAFGTLRARGRVSVGKDVDVAVDGPVTDVRLAREFTSRVVDDPLRFPEIRGRGTAEVKILGSFRRPQVKITCALAPGGFDAFNAAAVDGLVGIAGGEVTGVFRVNDPDAKGDIRLSVRNREVEVGARIEDGRVEPILSALALSLPFQGRAAGDLTIRTGPGRLTVQGRLSAEALTAAGVGLTRVRTGLEWNSSLQEIVLTDLEAGLFGGRVAGRLRLGLAGREYDADLKAEGLDLAKAAPALRGAASFQLSGRGSLESRPAVGRLDVRGLTYASFGPADVSGKLEVGTQDGRAFVRVADGALNPGANPFSLTFTAPRGEEGFRASVRGRLLNPEILVPWKGVKGEADFLFDLRGGADGVKADGAVDIKGSVLPIPGFPHAVTDFAALVRIQNDRLSLRSFQARMAGGDLQGTGEARLGPGGPSGLDVSLGGKGLALALLDKTRVLTDIDLRLEGARGRLILSGRADVRQLSWRREFSEKLAFAFAPRRERSAGPTFFDGMALDLRLRADEGALVENSMGRIQGRFDLTVAGTIEAPVLLGDIEALRGDVYFQDRTFRVVQGRLSFFNPSAIEPVLDFRGETFLKDYRVMFSVSGRLDRLRPEFASSPPLPPEDVLALLALGESFKRTYSYEASAQMGTGSLLSFQLAEEAKKRAEKLFALDSFRIDPFVLGASTEMTARLTVGKKISRNVILLYSTNLTSQREDLVRMEWDFTPSFALVVMRDERGRLSLDAKVRKRF